MWTKAKRMAAEAEAFAAAAAVAARFAEAADGRLELRPDLKCESSKAAAMTPTPPLENDAGARSVEAGFQAPGSEDASPKGARAFGGHVPVELASLQRVVLYLEKTARELRETSETISVRAEEARRCLAWAAEERQRTATTAQPSDAVPSAIGGTEFDLREALAEVERLRTVDAGREQKLRDLAAEWRRLASKRDHTWGDAVCLRGCAEEVLRVLDQAPGAQGDAGGGASE